ncbi:ATP-dependent endonuclease [Agromyces sp. MMS24-JH15]|uniref:ATP-dependent nuclease n=1 Tax=Agromyces sp. MMS24-JH15 TaxID=3243765 RepID=UPI003747CEC5
MYIKRLVVENVRSFEQQEFVFSNGLNLLVGENNSGKSTVFEALLYAATNYRPENFHRQSGGALRVEVWIAGIDLESHLADEKFARYRDYVFTDEDGDTCLRAERSDTLRSVTQSGKSVALDGKKLCLWHPIRGQFENPTGIDAVFRSLLDLEPIWATTEPGSVVDFNTTKTLGKMLATNVGDFFETGVWSQFETAHEAAFIDGPDSLRHRSSALADRLSSVVKEQYGQADIRFVFEMPDPSTFLKSGRVHVDDGSGETPLSAKGSGMQRALALAVIQEFGRTIGKLGGAALQSPLILLIDEPETWLHPRAQLRLAEALRSLASAEQLFVTTHSPYLFGEFNSSRDRVICMSRDAEGKRVVEYETKMGLVISGKPSVGEVGFSAFSIPTTDFHDELYGAVIRHLESNGGKSDETAVNAFLNNQGIVNSLTWTRSVGGAEGRSYSVSLPVFVRNSIHHPENTFNPKFTAEQLHASTVALVDLVRALRVESNAELPLAS